MKREETEPARPSLVAPALLGVGALGVLLGPIPLVAGWIVGTYFTLPSGDFVEPTEILSFLLLVTGLVTMPLGALAALVIGAGVGWVAAPSHPWTTVPSLLLFALGGVVGLVWVPVLVGLLLQ